MRPSDLRPVVLAQGPWPLHTAASTRAAEATAAASLPPHALMAQAGLAVARLARAIAPHAARVQVWAGPGNNGGDGLVAARHLQAVGCAVQVTLIGDAQRLPPDAAHMLGLAREAGVPISDVLHMEAADLHIDALLGMGATRAPEGRLAAAVQTINEGRAPVLAVDLPSGLHADTGVRLGEQAVRATHTLSLLTLKPGCFTAQGRDHAGEVWFCSLGVDAGSPDAMLSGPPPCHARPHASHKGSHGDVAVVGGAAGMVGAAWLTARASLAAGAGRVICSPLDPSTSLFDPLRPELMGRLAWWTSPPAVLSFHTVACGCGGGDAVRSILPTLLAWVPRLVLDADALNAIAADPALQQLLARRCVRGLQTLLTPHPLEAARLLGLRAAEVQADRLHHAQALADRCACAVLLKGSGSIVASPGQRPLINPTGNAALATAGSGDVLAGWAAGLWAQQTHLTAAAVAERAAWQHGRAADLWPGAQRGAALRASDLIEALARLPDR